MNRYDLHKPKAVSVFQIAVGSPIKFNAEFLKRSEYFHDFSKRRGIVRGIDGDVVTVEWIEMEEGTWSKHTSEEMKDLEHE